MFQIFNSCLSVWIIHLIDITNAHYLFIPTQVLFYLRAFLFARFLFLVIYCILVLENSLRDHYTSLHKYFLVAIISIDSKYLLLAFQFHFPLSCELDTLIKGVWYLDHLILEYFQLVVSWNDHVNSLFFVLML